MFNLRLEDFGYGRIAAASFDPDGDLIANDVFCNVDDIPFSAEMYKVSLAEAVGICLGIDAVVTNAEQQALYRAAGSGDDAEADRLRAEYLAIMSDRIADALDNGAVEFAEKLEVEQPEMVAAARERFHEYSRIAAEHAGLTVKG